MIFRRMKGGSVVAFRVYKENNRKLTVNEWGLLEYYTPFSPLPFPDPPFFPVVIFFQMKMLYEG